jgi:hypothetical protein
MMFFFYLSHADDVQNFLSGSYSASLIYYVLAYLHKEPIHKVKNVMYKAPLSADR